MEIIWPITPILAVKMFNLKTRKAWKNILFEIISLQLIADHLSRGKREVIIVIVDVQIKEKL